MVKEIFFSWQFLAILSALIWATVNIVDKHVLTKRMDVKTATLFTALISLIIIVFFFLFLKINISNIFVSSLLIASGIIWIVSVMLYYEALKIEEVSRIVPIFFLDPIFTAILAAFFLGEIFSGKIYFGVILIVAGAILVSIKKDKNIFYFEKSFWMMLLATIIISVIGVIWKFALQSTDFLSVYFWSRFGTIIAAIPIFFFHHKKFFETLTKQTKVSGIFLLTNTASALAGIIIALAIAIGPVTLVSALTATQPLFLLIFTVMVSRIWPKILKERIDKKTIALKLAAIVMIIVGSYLVAV